MTKLVRSLPVDSEKYDVVVYVLDCCCGICDRDWTASRLRCDDLFVQAFADWSKCAVRIYTTLDGEEWTLVTPYRQPQTSCTFTFEVWREGERFMSKRKQRGRGDESIAEVADNMLCKMMAKTMRIGLYSKCHVDAETFIAALQDQMRLPAA